MRTESWLAVDRLLEAALDRPPAERRAFLDAACAGDQRLRREVESLLDADARAGAFLAAPMAIRPRRPEEPEEPLAAGKRVGPYRIVRLLNRGGTSTVYLARRDDGRFDKEVAVKILDRGLLSPTALVRFRTECWILAGLEHPSITRLYDAGSLADGRPYVVMEYVDGERIDTFCERRELPVEERLRLVRRVAAAVHLAHQHLVVHRDLKPGNILVSRAGVPKLLDFGIAKLLAPGEAEDPAEATVTWFQPMTPDYASPEQILGERITTATDVYALGLLLYRLLAGRLPHRFEGRSLGGLERFLAACDHPVRPSEAVAERPLRRRLSGDLDSIVLKALRREPHLRYNSAERLADDLGRHLSGLPVAARAGTFSYRASRFLRRHRLGMGVAAAFFALVVGFAASTARQAERLRQERDKLERTSSFVFDLFNVSPPGEELAGGGVTAHELLARGAERVDAELADSPDARAAMLDTLGMLFTALGSFADAEPLVEEGLALRRRLYGREHPDVATSLAHLGDVRNGQGRWSESVDLYRQALDLRRRTLGADHPAVAEAHRSLGMEMVHLGHLEEAEEQMERAVALHRSLPGVPPPELALSLGQLGHLRSRQGDPEAALPLLEEALALRRESLPAGHPDIAVNLFDLGEAAHKLGDLATAEHHYREALAGMEQVKGPDHPQTVRVLTQLAQTVEAAGRLAEAEALFRRALEIERRTVGEEHPEYATALNNLAVTLKRQGEFDQAEEMLRRALAVRLRVLGEDHPHVAQSRHTLASLLHHRGELEEAERLYRLALAGTDSLLPPDHPIRAYPRLGLAAVLVDRGKAEEAEVLAREAVALLEGVPQDHWRHAEADSVLGACLALRGRSAEAERLLVSSRARLAELRGAEDLATLQAAGWLRRLSPESAGGAGRPEGRTAGEKEGPAAGGEG